MKHTIAESKQLTDTLLQAIAGEEHKSSNAVNLRHNGESVQRFSSENIIIQPRQDNKPGIEVLVKPGTRNESVHIPVIVTTPGLNETVYNDFIIGEGAEVTIVAGCAIHNCGSEKSEHDGVHVFKIGKGAKVKYSEKHYGSGDKTSQRVLNPVTEMVLEQDAFCEIEMTQIEGVTSTVRDTTIHLGDNARVTIVEKLLTHHQQTAISNVDIHLNGSSSSARIISRSVAQDSSKQEFYPVAIGNAGCRAHIQCDSIIMDDASVRAVPAIEANHRDAQIVHEAAIGRINNEQLIKLETLGLSEEEAEKVIINAFLE